VKWQDLKDVFKTFDLYPTHVDIAMENQRSKGYGLVKFSSKEEADKAIQQVNGTDLFGRPLLIKQDKFQA
jgi:RNA recognition motif-containing protein